MWVMARGVWEMPGPACPSTDPARTRTSAPPSSEVSMVRSWPCRSWYCGAMRFFARGRLIHSCRPWNRPPDSTSAAGGVSMCRRPSPAVMYWVPPSSMVPPPPCESWWMNCPSMRYVNVSKPRCGCQGVPFGSPAAYSTSPIWSMWMNGSRTSIGTPAKARCTGNPSPSNPVGAVVTDVTDRAVDSAIGVRRGRVRVSAVTAGMGSSSGVSTLPFNYLPRQPIPGRRRCDRQSSAERAAM